MHRCIFNGTVVTHDELLEHHAVIIKNDRIENIIGMSELESYNDNEEEMEYFDAKGGYITPGFIDTHSDYIEGIIQPRPTSIMNFELSLREAEKQLVGNGITMMYHSLSLLKEDKISNTKMLRKKCNVDIIVKLINEFHNAYHLIRHRFHARYEIDNIEIFSYLEYLINEGLIHQLSFMDHTPGQGQYRDIEKCSFLLKESYNMKEDEFREFIEHCGEAPKATHEMLCKLSSLAKKLCIPVASHDDDSVEKIDLIKKDFGANISEFPINMEVAKKARDEGLYVVVGAPNIILGKSHAGNLNAIEAIKENCADIICSDYYPSAVLHSVFKLYEDNIISLPKAFRMVTANPAKAMGVYKNFGSIEVGKKADLLLIRKLNDNPVIEKVFIDGRTVAQFQYKFG